MEDDLFANTACSDDNKSNSKYLHQWFGDDDVSNGQRGRDDAEAETNDKSESDQTSDPRNASKRNTGEGNFQRDTRIAKGSNRCNHLGSGTDLVHKQGWLT